MSLQVIKYVAGGGKTTSAINLLKNNKNGLYLAFNNKVVNDVESKGYLSMTIDSLFVSYILPKIKNLIPFFSKITKISYCDSELLPLYYKGAANLQIDSDGYICNGKKRTNFNLNDEIDKLNIVDKFPNKKFIKYLFGGDELKLTDKLRNNLFNYVLDKYSLQLCKLIISRFSFVIIDEAQDLKHHQEKFIRILSNCSYDVFLFGDDYQNINGGGDWFNSLTANENINYSKRCPEDNCKWIRENLKIDIYGRTDRLGKVTIIKLSDTLKFDDGNRVLLYNSNNKTTEEIIKKWHGNKYTIKKSKGMTINNDIVIIGKELNIKNMYTAITRTTFKVYLTATLKK